MRQAESDMAVARLSAEQGFHSQACYHAGQAAEKALMAVLVAAGSTPPYSHSLDRLVVALADLGFNMGPLRQLHLKALSRMNTETRYPHGDEAPADLFDTNDSGPALSMATIVLEHIQSTLAAG
jgi:HEPN domain-containing protein